MMYQIGLSVGALLATEEMFRNFKKAGLSAIEVSHSINEHLEADDFPHFSQWAREYGVQLWSYHLPFMDPKLKFDISEPNTADATVARFKELIEQGAQAGFGKFIIHPSFEPIGNDEREARMERAKQSLRILADFAGQKGVTLCVENLPRTCLGRNSAEISELISVHPDLRVCFDTNHLLRENYVDFIKALGDKIVTVHVSDYDFTDEKHWLPGEGLVDWQLMYQSLRAVGYSGVWLYEMSFHNDKLSRTRDLICEDFVRNAKEIFEGAPLTTLLTKE